MMDVHETSLQLDGLELDPEMGGKPSALRSAVVATITALHADKLLEPRHAALCQLALELADSVSQGRRSGRASAAAMAAAQLRETLLALPAPASADIMEKFNDFVTSLSGGDE